MLNSTFGQEAKFVHAVLMITSYQKQVTVILSFAVELSSSCGSFSFSFFQTNLFSQLLETSDCE